MVARLLQVLVKKGLNYRVCGTVNSCTKKYVGSIFPFLACSVVYIYKELVELGLEGGEGGGIGPESLWIPSLKIEQLNY